MMLLHEKLVKGRQAAKNQNTDETRGTNSINADKLTTEGRKTHGLNTQEANQGQVKLIRTSKRKGNQHKDTKLDNATYEQ